MRSYITYATSLLLEKGSNEIVFKAMGRAINKTVMIVEVIKRRVAGLHQNTVIGSTDITDTWEPLEEGLLPLETTRHVSMIMITLSAKELEKSSVGYQSPLPVEQVKPYADVEYEENAPTVGGRGRNDHGRGRGRENGHTIGYGVEDWDNQDEGYAQGRGFRGRGRGYGGRFSHPQEGDNDINEAPSLRRGRGRGRGRGANRGRGRGARMNAANDEVVVAA
ncbi:hypothetical protein HPP92_008342 [Vanilla planifolia]|uniref:DNA/RNA-binding protein Alba-like domain-containing protein n=1 Tax=Vanilla planifolia TaxID=51239 RepID=A0A835RD57_VANPL|nr:hypothetical protein HPP92_008342 [Vanilla planifolia]